MASTRRDPFCVCGYRKTGHTAPGGKPPVETHCTGFIRSDTFNAKVFDVDPEAVDRPQLELVQ